MNISRIAALLFLVILFLIINRPLSAFANPAQDSCGFVEALLKNENPAGISYLEGLAIQNPIWPRATIAKLRTNLGPVTSRFHYTACEVFNIANLGNTTQEHMIAMQSKDNGIAYFRILYEWDGTKVSFINIKIKSSYYEMIKLGGIVSYTKVEC